MNAVCGHPDQELLTFGELLGKAVVAGGLQGPEGVSAATFTHVQSSPAMSWTINHNLGFKPDIALLDAGGVEFIGQIIHASVNQALVYLSIPTTGTARCT